MSNLAKRVLAGIAGIPLILCAVYFGGIYFLVFSIIVSSLALWEFCSMFEKKGFSPLKMTGVVVSVIMMVMIYINWKYFELAVIIIFPLISLIEIFRKQKDLMNALILLAGIIYITIPFVLLNEMIRNGFGITVIIIFVLIWTCDTAAYFGGRAYGKRKLSEISPNKTIEGSFTGFIFTLAVSLLIHSLTDYLQLTDAIALGILTGVFSQTGDLFESFIKRYCGVKDSSAIIPGHGGILDRFDSLVFVTPIIFVYFAYIR
jgi:phosphatidate cytidylyltransferase